MKHFNKTTARRAAARRKRSGLLTVLVLMLWAVLQTPTLCRADAPRKILEIHIQLDQIHPDGFDWAGLARALIDMREGDTLTAKKLDQALAALSPFGQVQSAVVPSDQGVRVIFTLEPFKRIESITIDGSYPLFEKDVRSVMTIAPGDFFRPREVQSQKPLIVQRFKAEGYIDPQVKITWHQDPQDGNYHLRLAIDKGPYYTLDKVRLTGNRAYSDDLLKGLMKTWRSSFLWAGGRRFVQKQLKSDVARITAFYRKRGFADVSVSPSSTYDAEHRKAVVDLSIQEGPRYIVDFAFDDLKVTKP